ncbi:MAG: nucleotidyltransferase family protein [Lysinibacillus sp.]
MYKIGAIILAAGSSSRMGEPKLLLPYKGVPIVAYPILRALQNDLHPIVCVTGRYDQLVRNALQAIEQKVTIQFNAQFESGMSTSLQQGIEFMKDKVDAVVIFLGDQPLLPNEVVQTIIQQYIATKNDGIKIIRPLYGEQIGHPILFDSSLFEAFKSIQGDEGGKSIIQQNAKFLKLIHFPNSDWGVDIDTPEDYANLMKKE